MGSKVQIIIKRKYSYCLSENIEDVETEPDNENSKQAVNQLPTIENGEEK